MNGEDEFGHINFGSRLVLQTDGTLEETQIESSASSVITYFYNLA